jgi:hypothetical protein
MRFLESIMAGRGVTHGGNTSKKMNLSQAPMNASGVLRSLNFSLTQSLTNCTSWYRPELIFNIDR